MANERAILCGDAPSSKLPFGSDDPLRLSQWGPGSNATLSIRDIDHRMLRNIPSQFNDLIDVATYVYCADQAVRRGGDGVDNFGENWRRRLFFRIPVRNPDLWNGSDLHDQLIDTLSFLSEDEYHFEFTRLRGGPPTQQCLDFGVPAPEEVALFSGGLDSLGGAVHSAVVNKGRVALVMHKSTHKLARRHRKLEELLKNHSEHDPIHVPVTINKAKSLNREYTQRSRSFLYAALGSTVAQMFGLSKINFYENGIVSFNLPPSPQVVGARATRTTHPQVINGFARIISILAGKPFKVENPFLWRTKAEVIDGIAQAGCAEMIKFATSCTHTWKMTRLTTHCGTCSQCIDRRFAVLATGLEGHDPAEAYGVDLLAGERNEGDDRTMLAAYVETANDLAEMPAMDFFSKYGEASRILRHLDGSADATAIQLFELHQRHAKHVTKVVDDAIAKHRSAIRRRQLPESCLLRLVCDTATSCATAKETPTPPKKEDDPPLALSDHVFRKKGQAWLVRFAGGKEFILLPCKGAAYLHELLSHPRTDFSVTDLFLHVAKAPHEYFLGDAGTNSERDVLLGYRAKYQELKEEINDAEEKNDLGRQDTIRRDMAMLAQQIKSDQGLGGRLRKAADDRDQIRKAFLASIRRVKKNIAEFDSRLSDHLKSPTLRCGWNPCYLPQSNIEWDT